MGTGRTPWEGWVGVTQAVATPPGVLLLVGLHSPPGGDITQGPCGRCRLRPAGSTWGLRLCISSQSEAHPGATGLQELFFTSFDEMSAPPPAPQGCLEGPLCNSSGRRVTSYCTRLSDVLLEGTPGSPPSVP